MSDAPERRPTVVLVGTLDTKGHEYAFVRDRIRARGVDVLLVDAGILGEPLTEPDVTRQEVAAAAGADVQALADAGDRSAAIEVMGRGAAEIVLRLHAEGRLDAIGALGGTGGTTIATHAMRALPIGVPKLMVSTVASGDTSPYVGTMDVTMMHSVVDVAGINRISARILANAARPLVGHGHGAGARARRREAARRGVDVGRHDAVRDDGPRAARGARLRRARLPPDRHRRQVDGGADRDRPRRRRPRRHARPSSPTSSSAASGRRPRAARGRRAPGDPAGRLARRRSTFVIVDRRFRIRCRAASTAARSTSTTSSGRDADDAGRSAGSSRP